LPRHPTLVFIRSPSRRACSVQRGSTLCRARKISCFRADSRVFVCGLSCFLSKLKARIQVRQKNKMHVIVLASQKGGAGKTTLAAHIAVAAEAAGDGPAVLIDADPQGSLSAWWNVREAQVPALAPTTIAELPAKLTALAEAGYAVAVVDTPPAITEAITAA